MDADVVILYYVTHSLMETLHNYNITKEQLDQYYSTTTRMFKPRYAQRSSLFKQEVADYYVNNHSRYSTASYFHVAVNFVQRVIEEYNLPVRTHAQELELTKIEKYGSVDNYNKVVNLHSSQTCLQKYGVKNFAQSSLFQQRTEATCLKKYGVCNAMQNDVVKEKLSQNMMSKYGVKWACMRPQARMHGNNSNPNILFSELLDSFNLEYVREFPLECYSYDFCLGSILVEINPTPTHNSTWGCFGGSGIDKDYHARKTQTAIEAGYRCINVWDWDNTTKIIQSLLDTRVMYARNCVLDEISFKDAAQFLNTHHFQGVVKSPVNIALKYDDEVVAVMTFGTPRYNKNYEWELLRLCSSRRITGGVERLYKYFIEHYNPSSIISYCDLSKFRGDVYSRLGFKHISTSVGKHWYNMKTQKHITDNLLRQRGFDQLLGKEYGCYGKGTNNEDLMRQHGFVEIYDAGQATYVWSCV